MNEPAELSPRQKEILAILVHEYITTATPVGSNTIRDAGRMSVSSATIRNELMSLEDAGFIIQPHTSAGRIPTLLGYRLFVEQLMGNVKLPDYEQRTIEHQFYQMGTDIDQWMKLTAAVLARAVDTASFVTPPVAGESRFRHIELISVSESAILLVMVLQDGSIHQEMLATTNSISQDVLSRASNRLNALFEDLDINEIRRFQWPEGFAPQDWEEQVIRHIIDRMSNVNSTAVGRIYHDGLVNVLKQPEFLDIDRFQHVLEIVERRGVLESVLTSILRANGVQVIIGGTGRFGSIDDLSLVLTPYGVQGLASGVLGVMGPTRMPYARAVSTVRYVSGIMSGIVAGLYGDRPQNDAHSAS